MVVRKKRNSEYVVENVLMRYRGAYVGNEGNKSYNKYNEGTLCKGIGNKHVNNPHSILRKYDMSFRLRLASGLCNSGSDGVATNPDIVGLPNLLKASFESVIVIASQVESTSPLFTSDGVAANSDAVFMY
nr:hypothetical protein [Tanacetum cinerariifolium]